MNITDPDSDSETRLQPIGSCKMKMAPLILPTLLLLLLLSAVFPSSARAQLASETTFDLELVDMYADFQPDKYIADIISVLYLTCNGSDPVILRCQGNISRLEVIGHNQSNLSWNYQPPYIWLYNLEAGAREVEIRLRARHDGFSPGGGTISTNVLDLGPAVFWYPRQNASDAHQVILNLETPPTYEVVANGTLQRDLPNNGRRLRTWIIDKPVPEGITLNQH
ncbi:MAG TPA: hypothetical protein PKM25_11345 [Candidatus Ozemobacteraceae bacterium]|nr:hypothetical protein [Candidatus Ozemobacteraceae bacterium]